MTTKTIKVSEENYLWLLRIAAELQKRSERPVSFDETIYSLRSGIKVKRNKLSNLAGSWKMSDKEADILKKNLKKGWGKWAISSV